MKKHFITTLTFGIFLPGLPLTTVAQEYQAAKNNAAPVTVQQSARQLNEVRQGAWSCSDPQKLNCETSIRNLAYSVCLPLNADLVNAKTITGNITLTNSEPSGASYYFTLYYSWKGTMITKQNTKVGAGAPTVINFTLNADPNYSGSINNLQVWLQTCRKVFEPK